MAALALCDTNRGHCCYGDCIQAVSKQHLAWHPSPPVWLPPHLQPMTSQPPSEQDLLTQPVLVVSFYFILEDQTVASDCYDAILEILHSRQHSSFQHLLGTLKSESIRFHDQLREDLSG